MANSLRSNNAISFLNAKSRRLSTSKSLQMKHSAYLVGPGSKTGQLRERGACVVNAHAGSVLGEEIYWWGGGIIFVLSLKRGNVISFGLSKGGMFMATRPVYMPDVKAPFLKSYMPEFVWNGGFAVSQKQKNIVALHEAFQRRFPESRVLEISSKSLQGLGVKLSAFNLKKFVPELGVSVPVECVFQGGKVFNAGGPYTDLYEVSPRDAKRDSRLKSSGMLKSFFFDGKMMPITPQTVFYDWIYINAVLENAEPAEELLNFDAFTDIEFNPAKSINCQAKAAALFVALARQGVVEECREFDAFYRIVTGKK